MMMLLLLVLGLDTASSHHVNNQKNRDHFLLMKASDRGQNVILGMVNNWLCLMNLQ